MCGRRKIGPPQPSKRPIRLYDPRDTGKAYVVVWFLLEVGFYVSLLLVAALGQWNANGNQLPDISLAFANSPAVAGVFIGACVVALLGRAFFWVVLDATPVRWTAFPPKYSTFWYGTWVVRDIAVFLQFVFLIATAAESKFVNPFGHAALATTAVACYSVSEAFAVVQRALYESTYPQVDPLNAVFLFVEVALLAVTLGTGGCFVSRVCVGGDPASAAYEFAMFFTFALTPILRVMDC